jgi:acyl-CoA reductase-like NAD-dependent aldehyde dehydrogenase
LKEVGMIDAQPAAERSARNWIDGAWTDEAEHRDSVDPATGQVIGTYAVGSGDSTTRAIAVASRAFQDPSWTQDRLRRSRVLNRMADVFERRASELVDLLALENGKVKAQGALEVAFAPETLRFNAALALTDVGTASVVTGGEVSVVLRQPVGVAGIIAPWNSPVALGIRSLAPALAAGCTTVMSLPRQTAQTNALIAELIGEVDELPVGAVNVITEAEAVALANGTVYGLSASVFTRDVDRALRVAGALDAGSVWINDWAKLHDQFEEGGFKASGVGRMRGFAVIDDFVEHKHIRLHPGTPA